MAAKAKEEVQSQNPAFSLGKAEDYGNGYGREGLSRSLTLSRRQAGRRSTYARIALYRRHSRYTSLRELGQGRKSLVGTWINIHGLFGTLLREQLINERRPRVSLQRREFLRVGILRAPFYYALLIRRSYYALLFLSLFLSLSSSPLSPSNAPIIIVCAPPSCRCASENLPAADVP